MSFRLAVGNVDIVYAVPLKELDNVLRGVESGVAVRAVGTDANLDGNGTGNELATTILGLLLPTEASEVDEGMPNLFTVEESNRLGMNVNS